MKAQTPAEGIMLVRDFGDAKFYRVDCTCGSDDDRIEVTVEIDSDIQEVQVIFETRQNTEWWKRLADWDTYKINNSWLYAIVNSAQELINGIHHRLVVTKDVWVHGYVKTYSSTYLTKQQALNFSQILVDSIAELEKNK